MLSNLNRRHLSIEISIKLTESKSNRTKFRHEVTRLNRYQVPLGESLNSFPFYPLFSSFLPLPNFSVLFSPFLFLFRPFASYLGYPMHTRSSFNLTFDDSRVQFRPCERFRVAERRAKRKAMANRTRNRQV